MKILATIILMFLFLLAIYDVNNYGNEEDAPFDGIIVLLSVLGFIGCVVLLIHWLW